jgi:hypothetical protein
VFHSFPKPAVGEEAEQVKRSREKLLGLGLSFALASLATKKVDHQTLLATHAQLVQ